MKRLNLCLLSVPEYDEENESKLENILQDIIQENFPSLARQDNTQLQVILISQKLAVLPISCCRFFIMVMLLTFWYVFGMADTVCSFLYVKLLSEALIKQAWW